MVKRKRGGSRSYNLAERPSEFEDRSTSKLNVSSYEDLADSEDEFLLNRDKILLDDQPVSKKSKRKREEDSFLQHSDEEVFGYSSDPDGEDNSVEGEPDYHDNQPTGDLASEDEISGWGNSKSAFYSTDKITTQEEALAEEQEARRLQQKRLKSLNENDFAIDDFSWDANRTTEQRHGEDDDQTFRRTLGVVREELPHLQIRPDVPDVERLKLLRRRYPEFEGFAKVLVELQPVWDDLRRDLEKPKAVSASATSPVSITQFRALSAYLGVLTMFFALLTSPARRSTDDVLPLALQPRELHEHEVVNYVHRCRETWESVKYLDDVVSDPDNKGTGDPDDLADIAGAALNGDEDPTMNEDVSSRAKLQQNSQGRKSIRDESLAASEARRAARRMKILQSLDKSHARLLTATSDPHQGSLSRSHQQGRAAATMLDELEADEKARQRKSLRFYTSRIAQKANKEARFADGAAGDEDVPHRERYRDRVKRLNRQAEARGKKDSSGNLEEEDNADEDYNLSNGDREAMHVGDDEYRDLMDRAESKKDRKRQREAAYQEAREQGGQVERVAQQQIGPDGRREIGYAIAKNKGLTPRRRKEVKNPRVKKRKRFEDKSKKLRTMKPTYKGGEGRGGYGGELTGIKTGLVKSTRL
ncbi:MAG: hypothetical protein Q9159_007080 [Coniocarpon cinnabarinum]